MDALWAMAVKDIRLLFRDRIGFFFAFFFPIIVAVFFGVIFSGPGEDGKPRRISVALVDEDRTPGSLAFAGELGAASELEVSSIPTRAEATNAVRAGGSVVAMIVLPAGFGEARERPFFGSGVVIELATDPARRIEAGMLEGILTKYAYRQFQTLFSDPKAGRAQAKSTIGYLESRQDIAPANRAVFGTFFRALESFLAQREGVDASAAPGEAAGVGGGGGGGFQPITIKASSVSTPGDQPLKKKASPPNAFAVTFPQGILWGVMGCALSFSISLVLERSGGTMTRLLAAPIRRWQILGGKALACFLVTIAVSIILISVGVAFFGVRPRSPAMLSVALVCTAFAFIGIMMLLAVFGHSERGGNGLGWGVLLLLSMIGGGMIPLFFMPAWMNALSVISPVRWAILAIEIGIWRPVGWGALAVPCGVLLAIGVGGFALGSRVFKTGV